MMNFPTTKSGDSAQSRALPPPLTTTPLESLLGSSTLPSAPESPAKPETAPLVDTGDEFVKGAVQRTVITTIGQDGSEKRTVTEKANVIPKSYEPPQRFQPQIGGGEKKQGYRDFQDALTKLSERDDAETGYRIILKRTLPRDLNGADGVQIGSCTMSLAEVKAIADRYGYGSYSAQIMEVDEDGSMRTIKPANCTRVVWTNEQYDDQNNEIPTLDANYNPIQIKRKGPMNRPQNGLSEQPAGRLSELDLEIAAERKKRELLELKRETNPPPPPQAPERVPTFAETLTPLVTIIGSIATAAFGMYKDSKEQSAREKKDQDEKDRQEKKEREDREEKARKASEDRETELKKMQLQMEEKRLALEEKRIEAERVAAEKRIEAERATQKEIATIQAQAAKDSREMSEKLMNMQLADMKSRLEELNDQPDMFEELERMKNIVGKFAPSPEKESFLESLTKQLAPALGPVLQTLLEQRGAAIPVQPNPPMPAIEPPPRRNRQQLPTPSPTEPNTQTGVAQLAPMPETQTVSQTPADNNTTDTPESSGTLNASEPNETQVETAPVSVNNAPGEIAPVFDDDDFENTPDGRDSYILNFLSVNALVSMREGRNNWPETYYEIVNSLSADFKSRLAAIPDKFQAAAMYNSRLRDDVKDYASVTYARKPDSRSAFLYAIETVWECAKEEKARGQALDYEEIKAIIQRGDE